MTFLDTKTLYCLFLSSDWWIALSKRKRKNAKRCEKCGSNERLQSHHKFYRENWFDTLISDLECLCRECHEAEHGIRKTIKRVIRPVIAPIVPPGNPEGVDKRIWEQYNGTEKYVPQIVEYNSMPELLKARGDGMVSRKEFVKQKARIMKVNPPSPKTKRRRKRPSWKRKKSQKPTNYQGCRPWYYNPTPAKKWDERKNPITSN